MKVSYGKADIHSIQADMLTITWILLGSWGRWIVRGYNAMQFELA